MIAAVDKYSAAWKSALQTRKEELKKAWAIPERKERVRAILGAWKSYLKNMREAKKNYKTATREIWKTYKEERKLCGRGVISDDKTLKVEGF